MGTVHCGINSSLDKGNQNRGPNASGANDSDSTSATASAREEQQRQIEASRREQIAAAQRSQNDAARQRQIEAARNERANDQERQALANNARSTILNSLQTLTPRAAAPQDSVVLPTYNGRQVSADAEKNCSYDQGSIDGYLSYCVDQGYNRRMRQYTAPCKQDGSCRQLALEQCQREVEDCISNWN